LISKYIYVALQLVKQNSCRAVQLVAVRGGVKTTWSHRQGIPSQEPAYIYISTAARDILPADILLPWFR
jgi:hypothetical protein